MIDKIAASAEAAVADIHDGATVMIGGFGTSGVPSELIDALIAQGARDLTIVSNNAGNGDTGLAALHRPRARAQDRVLVPAAEGLVRIRRAVSAPAEIELELVPQGNACRAHPRGGSRHRRVLHADRLRHDLAQGKETRVIDGRAHVLEYPLHGDFALIRADRGDRWGNLVYRKAARNFGPLMATAARCTIAQVREVVPLGALDPEAIVTPGIFVTRVVPDAGIAAARRRSAA